MSRSGVFKIGMERWLPHLMFAIGVTGVVAYAVVFAWMLSDLYRRWRMPKADGDGIEQRLRDFEQRTNDSLSNFRSGFEGIAKNAVSMRADRLEQQVREMNESLRDLKSRQDRFEKLARAELERRQGDAALQSAPGGAQLPGTPEIRANFDALFEDLKRVVVSVWADRRADLGQVPTSAEACRIFREQFAHDVGHVEVAKGATKWSAMVLALTGDKTQRGLCVPRPMANIAEIAAWYQRKQGTDGERVKDLESPAVVVPSKSGNWVLEGPHGQITAY